MRMGLGVPLVFVLLAWGGGWTEGRGWVGAGAEGLLVEVGMRVGYLRTLEPAAARAPLDAEEPMVCVSVGVGGRNGEVVGNCYQSITTDDGGAKYPSLGHVIIGQ